MTEQPKDRPEGDGLASMLGEIAGRCSIERDREIIIKAANALRVPTRDGVVAAAGSLDDQLKRIRDFPYSSPQCAPPKPAPDAAMREAQRNQLDVLHRYRAGAYALAETALADILALAAPATTDASPKEDGK